MFGFECSVCNPPGKPQRNTCTCPRLPVTQDDYLAVMQIHSAATLQAHTVWPPSLVEIAVDDGGAANEPDVFDEVSRQWTRAIVPNQILDLKARIASLEEELARMTATPAKPAFPARALAFGLQDIGLRLPVGF